MTYLLLGLLALLFIYDSKSKSDEVEGSKYFYISDGVSKKMYLKMHKDGMGREGLKKFVELEDRFLNLERMSVCTGLSYIVQATMLSNQIKDTFPKYNFVYHTIHLKQIAEPNKSVNLKIKC
jgi:hypothetical protein|tara:strand:- start:42 stop:407 length:366 start_codon:yes stop_codon:yes gene_type:complete